VELAASSSARQSGGLISAAISAVLTISYVAKLLGEHEDWLHERQIDMFPEDGCLHVNGVGDDGVPVFIDYEPVPLKKIIADERAAGKRRPH
jgi:hypothetical protein